jgi:hypothetical protein
MSEQEHKTLGQVCFERMWQAQGAATGAGIVQWAGVRPDVRAWWESAAAAVKAAVLAEQDTPQRLKDMDHATKMRDRAIRELKEGLAAINRAFVYRDALEQELAEIEARLALEPR